MNKNGVIAFLAVMFSACSPSFQVIVPEPKDELVSVPMIGIPKVIDVLIPWTGSDWNDQGVRWLVSPDSSVIVWATSTGVRVHVVPDTVRVLLPLERSKKERIMALLVQLLSTIVQK